MGRWIEIDEYDRQLRPRTLGVEFKSDNPNECYLIRYEKDEAEKMMNDVYKWVITSV